MIYRDIEYELLIIILSHIKGLLKLLSNVSYLILVPCVPSLKFAAILEPSNLRRLNNFIPNDHLVTLVSRSGVLEDKVEVNLLGVPMENGSKIDSEIETQIGQSNRFIHIRILNSAVSMGDNEI